MRKHFLSLLAVITLFYSCRESYEPKVISQAQSFLVVEGNLNPGNDSTIVRLTKTFKLDDTAKLSTINNAQVTIEGKDSSTYTLTNTGNGYYVSPFLDLAIGEEYQLRIRTSDGKEYLSNYVKTRHTPDIDSINWERDQEGVHIYANTNDPTGNSRYYRWDYNETWEIKTNYYSRFLYIGGGTVRPRIFPAEDVSVCWKYNHLSQILLANSVNLGEDIIYKKPLILIPATNERLQVRYSVLVKQYALDKDAYEFYEIMKKNSEEVGSLFAPLPSELKGNIQCLTDPAEPVIGYITASEEKKKRIFITIPGWNFFVSCYSVDVPKSPDSIHYYFGVMGFIPYDDGVINYLGAPPVCTDCTFRGGSTFKPPYW